MSNIQAGAAVQFFKKSQMSVPFLIHLFDPLIIISRLFPVFITYHLDNCFRSIEICFVIIKVHNDIENRNKINQVIK